MARKHEIPEYRVWQQVKQRCLNPRHRQYKDYGGRGITMCERWRNSFDSFLADVGPRPDPYLTLDRRDNDGNYEPNNCRWATYTEQNLNKRNNTKRLAARQPTEQGKAEARIGALFRLGY